MKTVLISVAHAAYCSDANRLKAKRRHPQGAVSGGYSEYEFSVTISHALHTALSYLSVPCEIFDASKDREHLTYSQILKRKVEWVNDRSHAIGVMDCIAIEVHHNSVNARGYSVHHCHGSTEGLRIAEALVTQFAARKWSYPHWPQRPTPPALPGVVERPGKYGGSVDFLSKTACPAIITEAQGMGLASWIADNLALETEIIREGLCRVVG
jgi:hypothetical protein